MKYKLDISRLNPGDIILAGYNDAVSKKIQSHTNSLYSHAMLYWFGSIIHSASPIVITQNPSRMLFEEGEKVCALHLKDYSGKEAQIQESLLTMQGHL